MSFNDAAAVVILGADAAFIMDVRGERNSSGLLRFPNMTTLTGISHPVCFATERAYVTSAFSPSQCTLLNSASSRGFTPRGPLTTDFPQLK